MRLLDDLAADLFSTAWKPQPRRAVGFAVRLNSFIEFYGDINRKIEAQAFEAGKL